MCSLSCCEQKKVQFMAQHRLVHYGDCIGDLWQNQRLWHDFTWVLQVRLFFLCSFYFGGLWLFQIHMWLFFSGRPTSSPQCRITTTSLRGQMNVKCISPTSRAGTAATIVSSQRNVSLPTGLVCSTYTSISRTGNRHLSQRTAQTHEVQTLGCFWDSEPLCPFEDKWIWTFELEHIMNESLLWCYLRTEKQWL